MRIFYAIQFPEAVKRAMADNVTEIKNYTVRGSFTRRAVLRILSLRHPPVCGSLLTAQVVYGIMKSRK